MLERLKQSTLAYSKFYQANQELLETNERLENTLMEANNDILHAVNNTARLSSIASCLVLIDNLKDKDELDIHDPFDVVLENVFYDDEADGFYYTVTFISDPEFKEYESRIFKQDEFENFLQNEL